jgi:hypothetical protein
MKMRAIVLAGVLALVVSTPALAAIVLVDKATGGNGSPTGAANASGSNLAVIMMSWYDGGGSLTPAITDTGGHTWTQRLYAITSGIRYGFAVYDAQGSFSNGVTVTVGGLSAASYGVGYYSGAATTAYGNGVIFSGSSHTSTIQPGSLTAPGNGYLYVSGVSQTDGQTGTATVNSGFTVEQSVGFAPNEGHAYADIIQTTAAALNPTWSGLNGGNENQATLAYWAPSGGGGGGVTPHLGALLGVGN